VPNSDNIGIENTDLNLNYFVRTITPQGEQVVAQPLGAIAHFSHRPHAGGECQKTIVSVKYQKDQKESLEQRRITPNSGG
jgi:hypothetical protein